MCLALLEAGVIVMNPETWSLPLSLSSSYPSSAPSSHPSKSYYPTFPSCKTKVLMDIDRRKISWKKMVLRRKELFIGAVLELQAARKDALYIWKIHIPKLQRQSHSMQQINVNLIYQIVLVCGQKEGVWKNSSIITVNNLVLYILCICKIWYICNKIFLLLSHWFIHSENIYWSPTIWQTLV